MVSLGLKSNTEHEQTVGMAYNQEIRTHNRKYEPTAKNEAPTAATV